MRPVNLMKSETSGGRGLPPVSVLLACLAPIVAIGIVLAAYSYEQGTVTKSKDNLAAAQARVAALPHAQAVSLPELAALATEGNARRSSLDSALADRFALYPTLVAISRVLPSDVWLTSLNLTSPTPADTPPPAPAAATSGTTTTSKTTTTTATTPAAPVAPPINVNALTINGYTYSHRSVARLMTQLSLLPMLSNVTLTSSVASTSSSPAAAGATPSATGKPARQKTLVQFAVSAAVNPTTTTGEGT